MVTFAARLPAMGPQAAPPPPPPAAEGIHENFVLPDPNGNLRTVRVFLPATYAASGPKRSYPLLLMQDGQNVFKDDDAFMGRSWRLGAALFDGRQSGHLRDVIAVGIDNAGDHKKRADEYTPWPGDGQDIEGMPVGGGAKAYTDWVRTSVMPELERRYRILPGPEHRIVGGSSLGAVASLFAAAETGLFGGAMLMSGTYWWAQGAENLVTWIKSRWQSVPPGMKLWVSVGNDERGLRLYKANHDLRDTLRTIGFVDGQNFKFAELPGGHDEPSWRRQINDPDKQGPERYGPLGFFFPA